MMYVDNVPNPLDLPDVFNEIDMNDFTAVVDAPNDLDVSDVLDESDIFSVTDVLDVFDIFSVTDVLDGIIKKYGYQQCHWSYQSTRCY
jgi:hypothetical protein